MRLQVKGNLYEKLQTQIVAGLRKRQELVSVYLTERSLQAVVYTEEENTAGVSFTYTQAVMEAAGTPWYQEQAAFAAALQMLVQRLQQEDYRVEKLCWLFAVANCACQETLELPLLPKQELEEAISWELPQRLSWEEGSYIYKYVLAKENALPKNTLAELQQAVIYVLPKSIIGTLTAACRELQLVPCLLTAAEALPVDMEAAEAQVDFYEEFYCEEKLAELRQQYRGPVALARCYMQGKITLNFLSRQEQGCALLLQTRSLCGLLSLGLCLLSLTLGVFGWGWHSYAKQQLAQVENQYAQQSFWEQRRQELQKLQNDNQRLAGSIHKLQARKILWSKYLGEMGKIVPRGSWLTMVAEETADNTARSQHRLLLNGRAENMELINLLVKQLAGSNSYSKVELLKTGQQIVKEGRSSRQVLDFSIRLELHLPSGATQKTTAVSKEANKHGRTI